jgi:cell division transport system ATP-binding protein
MEVLEYVGIGDRADELPPVLSGGEKQRVTVARAMVGAPKIVLADEPTGSLDPDSAARIFALLEAVHRSGATVIIATHDQQMINNHKGRVIRLEKGRIADPADSEDPAEQD